MLKRPSTTSADAKLMPLTDLTVRSASAVGTTIWDSQNFGLRIGKQTKTWIVLLGNGRRHRIGHYPTLSLADARKEARRILAEKELGRIRPERMAFDDAKCEYLAHCATKNRPRTVRDYTWLLERLPFGRQAVGDITHREIIRRLKDLDDAPATRQHVFVAARGNDYKAVPNAIAQRAPEAVGQFLAAHLDAFVRLQ